MVFTPHLGQILNKIVIFAEEKRDIIMDKLIGREKEIAELKRCVDSSRSEFIVVYGRRRVGKTFLINQLYSDKYAFYYTGGHNLTNTEQLARFSDCLKHYSKSIFNIKLKDWFDAFEQLRNYIDQMIKQHGGQ